MEGYKKDIDKIHCESILEFFNTGLFTLKVLHNKLVVILYPPIQTDVNDCKLNCNEMIFDFHFRKSGLEYFENVSKHFPPGFYMLEIELDNLPDNDSFDLTRLGFSNIHFYISDSQHHNILPYQDHYWLGRGFLPLPQQDNIVRIAGNISLTSFLLGGSTWFKKLIHLTRIYFGSEIHELSKILDWGCGCGRIARHFLELNINNLVGVDIDPVNIKWCKANLPGCEFYRTDYDPPLPFEDNYFDLIYGQSVFTHLSEGDQFAWLEELARVVRVGGYVFVTYCGELGLFMSKHHQIGRNPSALYKFIEEGYVDFGPVSAGVDDTNPGYYRLVAHSTRYIRTKWSIFFLVKSIIYGFAGHQNLVILQKVR